MTNRTPRGPQRRTGQERRVRNIGPGKRERRSGEEALAAYDEALRLDPHNADAHNNRGISLRDLERHDKALAADHEALRARAYHEVLRARAYHEALRARAHYSLGNLLGRQGRHEEALAAYDEALRLDPQNADAHNNRGIALRKLGRHE